MKKVRILNCCIIVTVMILNTVSLWKIGIENHSRLGSILSLYGILLLPYLCRKFLNFKIHPVLECIYLIFIFFAQYLGSVVNLYIKTEWYDLLVHTVSGFLSGYVAIYLLIHSGYYKNKNLFFQIVYILGIASLIAVVWELLEYGMDKLFGSNTQHALETGVNDTMEDLLVAFVGGFLFMIFYSYEVLKNKVLITRSLNRFMK